MGRRQKNPRHKTGVWSKKEVELLQKFAHLRADVLSVMLNRSSASICTRRCKMRNAEHYDAVQRKYRERNAEREKAKKREYNDRNREMRRAKARVHYRENKAAYAVRGKEFRAANPERCKQHYLNFYYRHRDKILAAAKLRLQNNPDLRARRAAAAKLRRQKNKETIREQARIWKKKNPDRIAEYGRRNKERRQANKAKIRAQARAWRQANPEKIRTYKQTKKQADAAYQQVRVVVQLGEKLKCR